MWLVLSVGITWLALAALVTALGGFSVPLAASPMSWPTQVRVAFWMGLGILVVALATLNLAAPLASAGAQVTLVVLAGVSIGVAVLLRRRQTRPDTQAQRRPGAAWVAIPIGVMTLALVLIAHAFAGPIENWDAGLYQLNAIQYSAEYPIIPGLANLHDRLGTNMASSLIAALLSGTFWGIDAFRLLVGFFVAVLVGDITLRLLDRRERSRVSPGLVILLLGAAFAVPFLLSSPGTWVTSPTPDTISMLLVLVATAYLADAVYRSNRTWSVVAAVVAVVSATVRTQLWVFAGLVVVAVILQGIRRRRATKSVDPTHRAHSGRGFVILGTVLVLATGIVMMIRDMILSGWLLFPASSLPLPVDWRVPDPDSSRQWILSWARQPGSSPDEVLKSWSWLWPWVGRTATDWAVMASIGLVVAGVLLAWFMARSGLRRIDRGPRVTWRRLGLVLAPSLAAIAVWFWTAPDPRFAWGPILAVGAVSGGAALLSIARAPRLRPVIVPFSAALLTLLLAGPLVSGLVNVRGFVAEEFQWRDFSAGPISFTVAINPVESATTTEFTLDDGNTVITPTQDDRCHLAFPLCRPYPDATLQFRGSVITDGFRSARADAG